MLELRQINGDPKPGMDRHDDEALLHEICRGDRSAFKGLYIKHYPSLFSYAMKISQNEEIVHDQIQELFSKIWINRESLHDIKSIKAYLLSSIRRGTLKELKRKRKKEAIAFEFHSRFPDIQFSHEMIHIGDKDEQLRKSIVKTALNDLPKRQREIIYLKFFEELSYEEIAQITDIKYQSVVNHVQRSIIRLRDNPILAKLIMGISTLAMALLVLSNLF